MDTIVEFKNISKTYDGITHAVRDLNLEIARGEFLTLLGPSGSGKTTSLMLLAGFEAPTSGEITLGGSSLSKLPPYKRDIGVVFQNYALFPHMTVAENIAFPLKTRKVARDEIRRRVDRALEMVRLPGFGSRRPTELSGGQQQRVALARALVFAPVVVLMDEPLGALDRQLREEMQLEIRSIHEALGVTVLYVTHDQGEALTMSDRVAVFNKGIIEQLAAPEVLYKAPENAFVACFVGENNAFEGKIRNIERGICHVELPGTGIVKVRSADLRADSASCVITVRPELVQVHSSEPRDQGVNSLSAILDEVIYLGDHTKLLLRLQGEQRVTVKLPAGHGKHRPGQRLTLSWCPEDCLGFMTESDAILGWDNDPKAA